MKHASVCSGIGAPEEAWKELWGPPEFVSEIEPFPSAVLKHHMPDVPNHGDMTKYQEWPDHEELGLICAGTPCQSFSVAGLRKGMDDPRGNLTLTFLGLLARYNPRWFVWENVPGVLSSISDNGSDFGRFLSALSELGYSCCYRVLDAQYFGVPQRRRRVFVVGYLGTDWRPPFAVLSEPESLRGYTPQGGKAGEGVAGCFEIGPSGASKCEVVPTLDARCKDGPIRNQIGALVMAHGQGNAEICEDGSPSSTCNHEAPIVFENHMQDSRIKQVDVCPSISAKAGTGGGNLPLCLQEAGETSQNSQGSGINENVCFTLNNVDTHGVQYQRIIRRITPKECERLQGFPDGYTLIPWKKGMATDGHRYKALGNSMAVPVVRWIGERIQMWEDIQNEN